MDHAESPFHILDNSAFDRADEFIKLIAKHSKRFDIKPDQKITIDVVNEMNEVGEVQYSKEYQMLNKLMIKKSKKKQQYGPKMVTMDNNRVEEFENYNLVKAEMSGHLERFTRTNLEPKKKTIYTTYSLAEITIKPETDTGFS